MYDGYKYIAFISYKREDEKYAKWLQYRLEHYKLPSIARQKDSSLPKMVRPVFRDTTDLTGGVLEKVIKDGLDSSKYLIIVCSPRAAQSEWVCKEVQEFIDSGREEYIIPYIIEGEPNAKEAEKECFPENLRALSGSRELKGININEGGRDLAAIKIIAHILGLQLDILWERWAREKKIRRRWIISLTLLGIFMVLAVAGVMFFQQRRMQENLARAVANRAEQLIDEGDSYLARKLLVEVLPDENDILPYPYTAEAEAAMRRAYEDKSVTLARVSSSDIRPTFTQDGKLICFGLPDDTVIRLWDIEKQQYDSMVFKGHTKHIYNAVASPDGERIVSHSYDNTIRGWDVRNGECLFVIKEQPDASYLAFSPDNRYFLSVSEYAIKLWSAENGELQRTFAEHSENVTSAVFSPTGEYIVSSSFDDTIKLWSIDKRESLHTYDGQARSVAFDPNGEYIVSTSYDRQVKLSSIYKREELHTIDVKAQPYFVIFSPDGKYILSEYERGILGLWSVETKERVKTFVGHEGDIIDATFSSDGKYLASAASDETVKLWSVETEKCIKTFEGHNTYLDAITFSPDGKYIVYRGASEIKVWNIEKQILNQEIGLSISGSAEVCFSEVCFSQDGQYVINNSSYSTDENEIRDVHSWKQIKLPSGKEGFAVSYQDDIYMLSYDRDTLTLHNLITNDSVLRLGIKDILKLSVISPDAKYIATVWDSDPTKIYLLDASTGKCVWRFEGHTDVIDNIVFSPNGKYILSKQEDWNPNKNCVKLWSIQTGICIKTFMECKFVDNSMIFSPDSRFVTIEDKKHHNNFIWDLKRVNKTISFVSFAESIYSKDGSVVIFGYLFRGLTIIKGNKARQITSKGMYSSAVFSPDYKYIATIDGALQLWNVESGRCVYTFDEEEEVEKVAFSPNGKQILYVLANRKVKIWDFKSLQQLVDESNKFVKDGPLTPEEREEYYLY